MGIQKILLKLFQIEVLLFLELNSVVYFFFYGWVCFCCFFHLIGKMTCTHNLKVSVLGSFHCATSFCPLGLFVILFCISHLSIRNPTIRQDVQSGTILVFVGVHTLTAGSTISCRWNGQDQQNRVKFRNDDLACRCKGWPKLIYCWR